MEAKECGPKRLKTSHPRGNSDGSVESNLDDGDPTTSFLPTSVWANVVNFLYFDEAIRCTCLNKTFLGKISSLVEYISVRKKATLRGSAVRRRFSSAKMIVITCLLSVDQDGVVDYTLWRDADEEAKFCVETSWLIVPFIVDFPRLRRVFIGGEIRIYDRLVHISYMPRTGTPTFCEEIGHMFRLIRQVCEAYSSGSLRSNARIFGLVSGHNSACKCRFDGESIRFGGYYDNEIDDYVRVPDCPYCCLVCKHFPPIHVLELDPMHQTPCIPFRERFRIALGRDSSVVLEHTTALLLRALKYSSFQDIRDRMNRFGSVVYALYFSKYDWEEIDCLLDHGANARDPRVRQALTEYQEGWSNTTNSIGWLDDENNVLPKRQVLKSTFQGLVKRGFDVTAADFDLDEPGGIDEGMHSRFYYHDPHLVQLP